MIDKQYKTWIYLRLSKEDDRYRESESIANQRELIKQYVQSKDDLIFYGEFVDDGFSGTNFNRPAFQNMIKKAEKGEIECIIVKDLSRLGRNYIEVGKYIYKIFPILGVRLISINENYDSSISTQDDFIKVSLLTVVHDSISRDLSQKITSNLKAMKKEGKFVSAFAVFGYKRDENNKNKLTVDTYAACIVRDIFLWKIEGLSCNSIAQRLNQKGVLSPYEYKKLNGSHYYTSFQKNNQAAWSAVTVKNILQNEIYLGTMVQAKSEKISYRIAKSTKKPKQQWIRVKGTHDAIMDTDTFYKVQWLLSNDTRTSPNHKKVYPFSGILKCKDCGENLVRRPVKVHTKNYIYYFCSSYKKDKSCTSHRISHSLLEKLILEIINCYIDCFFSFNQMEKKINFDKVKEIELFKMQHEKIYLEKEEEKYQNLKVSLYESLIEGIIEQQDFQEWKLIYQKRLSSVRKKLQEKKEQLQKLSIQPEHQEQFDKEHLLQIDRTIIVNLIKKIKVSENKEIEIQFHFLDEFQWIDGDAYV